MKRNILEEGCHINKDDYIVGLWSAFGDLGNYLSIVKKEKQKGNWLLWSRIRFNWNYDKQHMTAAIIEEKKENNILIRQSNALEEISPIFPSSEILIVKGDIDKLLSLGKSEYWLKFTKGLIN